MRKLYVFFTAITASLAVVFVASTMVKASDISDLRSLSNAYVDIAENASAAVVFITAETEAVNSRSQFRGGPNALPPELFEKFFGPEFRGQANPQSRRRHRGYEGPQYDAPVSRAQGTGFIVFSEGYIMTNSHVVEGADHLRVKLADGREFDAELVGSDPATEVAVIKIDETGLPTLPLGDSSRLRVGEWVVAIGNPFGLSHSVTAGIVSAKGRNNLGITDYADFIQTDAAINPGNSGGPLLNLQGEVIGMNTAIFSRSGGYMGIGFAIPINLAKHVKDQLIENGKVTRGFLGILIQDMTPDLAEWFEAKNGGVIISDVNEGSPAKRAGLQRDDVVVEYEGEAVENSAGFRNAVAMTTPDTRAEIVILRNGKRLNKTIKLGKLEETQRLAKAPAESDDNLGFHARDLTPELAARFGYENETGVLVTEVARGSLAERAGLRPGTLIVEVNRQAVNGTRELAEALASQPRGRATLLQIQEGDARRYVTLRLDS